MTAAPTRESVLSWPYVVAAFFLHAVFLGVFGLAMVSFARETPPQLAIKGVIVDAGTLVEKPAPRDTQRKREEQRRREEELRAQEKQREQDKQREQEKLREQEKEREEVQKREQEQQRVEQERLAAVEREAQQQRAEQEKRQREAKAEAERKRIAEIERKQKEREADERRQADARDQQSRESDLKRQLEEEEGQMQLAQSGVVDRYRALIQQHIYRYWNRPPSARPGIECEINITQALGGSVLSAKIGRCNGDSVVQQSIENAVLAASPLPSPEDPRAFQRNLILLFKPRE